MFVSEARFRLLQHNMEQLVSQLRADLAQADARYDALLEKYHELAKPKAAETSAVVIPEPESPPPEVMAAIQAISPTRDKTYDANWAFWERNQARAKLHPDAFAEEIMQGAVYEPAEVDA